MSRKNINDIFTISDELPFNTIGLFTFLRTYARRHEEDNPNSTVESWQETLQRVVLACNSQLKVGFTDAEMKELFNLLYNLKCSVAGRFLWQLGTKTVDKLGLPSLQNCAATVVDEPVRPFTWAMNFLMLGCGVGFRILPSDIDKIPPVKYAHNVRKDTNDADFIVPDSREGWVKLLGKVLKSHFYSGESFTYSCTLLRSKGAPIKGFGGLASGPEVLCQGMTKIDDILNARAGQKLRPIDALDIMNIIGMIVVSGNVRRSALLALGDVKDTEYLKAKRWDLGNIPNYRAFSNNSIVCNDIADILDNDDFWQGYHGNGEPYGLINLALSQSCGRLGETQYPDPDVIGYNPCAEMSLSRGGETCCLSELYLPNISSKEELFKCATYMYRICKHSLTLPCEISIETEKIVRKNMRMGIGVTGYLQATDEQRSWLSDCYLHLREFDKNYSIKHGFPVSIKLATCKPSGCARRDMLIQTNKGLLRLDEIGDIEGEQWQEVTHKDLYAIDKDGEKRKILKFYINGNVPTKKIKTIANVEFEVSHNHRFMVHNGSEYTWKYAPDIQIGDKLLTVTGGYEGDNKGVKNNSVMYDIALKRAMANPSTFDDIVVSIEDSQCDTYDIEVDTIHHYRMNGTISHNTLSLLGGVTSGVHPGFARYYKRRIRIASESPLIKLAKDNGYHVEYVKHFDGSTDHTTQIVTFPCRLPDNTVLAEDCTAIDQLEWVKKLQTEWSDNSVSVTVYYRKHEIPEIKEWLRKNYNNSVKTVSFLLHSDHGFQQAPLEQITKAEYEELVKQCKPIKSVAGICFPEEDESLIGQNECVGGACPLR